MIGIVSYKKQSKYLNLFIRFMLSITKELIFYGFKVNNNFFLLVISCVMGWNILKLKSKCFLFKDYYSYFKMYGFFILKNFMGCYNLFLQYILLKGMNFKSVIVGSNLVLRLQYSHRLVYKVQTNIKVLYLNKQTLLFKSRSLNLLKKVIYFLQKFGKINAYKKKGIFLKGSIINFKVSSKKSKF